MATTQKLKKKAARKKSFRTTHEQKRNRLRGYYNRRLNALAWVVEEFEKYAEELLKYDVYKRAKIEKELAALKDFRRASDLQPYKRSRSRYGEMKSFEEIFLSEPSEEMKKLMASLKARVPAASTKKAK